jgi:hypothetical protein
MHAVLSQGSPIKVRVFQDRKEVAKVRRICRMIDVRGVSHSVTDSNSRGNPLRQSERKLVVVMASKFLLLVFGIGLTICVAQVQAQLLVGTPAESPSTPKHRTQQATDVASPAESATSPSAATTPAASPKPRPVRRKAMTEVAASPTSTPVASPTPRKFKLRFPRLFKPRTSPSASPPGVN